MPRGCRGLLALVLCSRLMGDDEMRSNPRRGQDAYALPFHDEVADETYALRRLFHEDYDVSRRNMRVIYDDALVCAHCHRAS